MIKISDLNFTYGNNFKLNINNLEINNGENLSVIGPNGSGKSTLIKIFSGILNGYSGKIEIENNDISKISKKKLSRIISTVPQDFTTIYDYNTENIIETSRYPYTSFFNLSENKEDRDIIDYAIKITDLERYRKKYYSELSGGEKQRVMIARAIAQDTEIMLLDEFTSHLDPGHTQNLMKIIQNYCINKNKTVISVFHDINLASLYSKRILVMKDGEIKLDGTPYEIITRKNIEEIYGFDCTVISHPIYKVPQIIFN